MSILIKGLNMPKDIASNVHRTITLIISGDGTIYDVDRNQLPYEAVEIKETHGRHFARAHKWDEKEQEHEHE